MENVVIAGDYKGYLVSPGFKNWNLVGGFKKKIPLTPETVESFEVVDKEEKRSAGKILTGGLLLGGVGALMGASSKKRKIVCKIVFKDGKKCLVKLNNTGYSGLQRTLF